MRTLKKIAAGLLAAALAVGLLTACSDNKVTGTAKSWSLSNTGIGNRKRPFATGFIDL